ncbi:ATP-binding protein [soil metagenome]
MTTTTIRPPLARTRIAVLGGVCSGLARHLRWNAAATRWLFVGLTLLGGSGVLLYLWLWALVPLEQGNDAPAPTRKVAVAAVLDAIAALAILAMAVAGEPVTSRFVVVAIAAAAALAWGLLFDGTDPARSARYIAVTKYLALVFLAGTGVVAVMVGSKGLDGVIGFIMIVLALAFLAAPRVITLWTDLLAERATRVRQEQRAEIAAHLHDSVLQTLALIQNRAGASSEVARIARAQERELRDWLFTGDDAAAADLATELKDVAAAIELDYPVRIEFVTAGDSTGHSSSALVAAAREALLNAARHAGGDVSVYVESSPSGTDVFVRDRGAGVDLASLPDDRLGIRESIIGRMARAGGTATVTPGAGGVGTEVHLHLEAPRG